MLFIKTNQEVSFLDTYDVQGELSNMYMALYKLNINSSILYFTNELVE